MLLVLTSGSVFMCCNHCCLSSSICALGHHRAGNIILKRFNFSKFGDFFTISQNQTCQFHLLCAAQWHMSTNSLNKNRQPLKNVQLAKNLLLKNYKVYSNYWLYARYEPVCISHSLFVCYMVYEVQCMKRQSNIIIVL